MEIRPRSRRGVRVGFWPSIPQRDSGTLAPARGWRHSMSTDRFDALRRHMLVEGAPGTIDGGAQSGKAALAKQVIETMGSVPRHEFVPLELQPYAYVNSPLPIGCNKTISQPF